MDFPSLSMVLILLVAGFIFIVFPILLLLFNVTLLARKGALKIKLLSLGGLVISLVPITLFLLMVGPWRSGVLIQGMSPAGNEYCIVQTYKNLFEPYQVSFYIRDEEGLWHWNYLEHEDNAWRSADVKFKDKMVVVFRNGKAFKEIELPREKVDLSAVLPGYSHHYLSAEYSFADVLDEHNSRYSR